MVMLYQKEVVIEQTDLFLILKELLPTHLLMVDYMDQVQNYDQSKSQFRWLTSKADSVLDGWMNLAKVYHVQDSIEMAIAIYEDGLSHMQNMPDSMIIYYSMAAANESIDSVDKAIEQFELVIENQKKKN